MNGQLDLHGYSRVMARLKNGGAMLYVMVNFLHFSALFASRPYISLVAAENSASLFVIGAITSLYSIGQVFWAMPMGKLIDRIGSRMPLIGGSAAFLASMAGLILGRNLYLIAISAILMGLAHVVVLLSSQNIMTGLPAGDKRDTFIGLITFANSAGAFAGPVIGGFMQDTYGPYLGFLGAAGIGAICLLAALIAPNNKNEIGAKTSPGYLNLVRDPDIRRTALVSAVVLFSTEVVLIYLPIHGKQIGLSAVMIGTILSVSGMAQMVIRLFLRRLIVWFKRERLLEICLIFGGCSILCYGLARASWLFFLVAGFSGMMLGLSGPLTLLAVSDIAPPGQRSQILALRVMGNYLGQSISPVVFGLLSRLIGLMPVFWISGAILALSASLVRKSRRPKEPDSAVQRPV